MKITRKILLALAMMFVSLAIYAQGNNYFIHTVKRGETLYSISRTYNTTVDKIVELNPGSAAKINIGQELRIPQETPQNENTQSTNTGTARYHTIQAGETLYRLGQMYNISPHEICDANPGLSRNNFRTGEVILSPSPAVAEPAPVAQQEVSEQPAEERTHKVKRGETIEEICEMYGITRQELIDANPQLANEPLKRRMVLNIPEHKETPAVVVAREETNNEIFSQYNNYRDSINTANIVQRTNGTVKVGIVLSFLLDSYAPSEQSRVVEYYQGFLMAVEQLKREGYSFEINTFDAGPKEKSLDSLLTSGALDRMNLLIGATYTSHNKELATFAKRKEIPLVIPFANKEDEIYRNSMVYIVNSQQSYIIPEVTSQFVQTFPNANVIFVEDTIRGNKMDFVTTLTEELDREKMPHTTVSIANFTGENKTIPTLRELRVEGKDNIIIPPSASSKTLTTLLQTLVQAKRIDSTSVRNYKLFGYPEWQIYAANTHDHMYEIETYFYASFYSHYSIPEAAAFQNNFIRWYGCNIQNIYPRFAMMGYDTGYYFLLAISNYGKDLAEHINEITFSPIQTGFRFERVNNWGGMVNKKYYFIHYRPDFLIEKIEFDK